MPSQDPVATAAPDSATPSTPTPRRQATPRQKVIWREEFDRIIIENRGRMSASLIADLIGHGCTRNSVIGRAHRLGLEKLSRQDPERTTRPRSTVIRRRESRVPDAPQVIDTLIPFEQRKTLLTLGPGDCRWPVGDPQAAGFFFCGAEKFGQESYCAAHYHRAHTYTPRPGERKPAARNYSPLSLRVFGPGAAPADRWLSGNAA